MKTDNLTITEDIYRSELAYMMVRGLGLPLVNDVNETFSDVTSVHDDVYFIETAARYGIINGDEDGNFKPDQPLTREETAVIITRVANLKVQTDAEKCREKLEKIFGDGASISYWAAPAVIAACGAKFMVGDKSKNFNPDDYLARSEAAKITYLLLKNLRKFN